MMNRFFLFACAAAVTFGASAKTCTWINGGGDWADTAHWQDGQAPEDGDDVVFAVTAAQKGGEINLGGAETAKLASLAFSDTDNSTWSIKNGTIRMVDEGEVVFSNSTKATTRISAVIAGAGDFVKSGNGTLSLSGSNTFTGRMICEDGRLQPESPAAYGPAPETYRADAIVLRNGGVLSSPETQESITTRIGATRGVTLVGSGKFCPRSKATFIVESPIVGDGDLHVLCQNGEFHLAAANAYTGRTYAWEGRDTSPFAFELVSTLCLDVDRALPETTVLCGASAASATATVKLGGTVQRVKGLEPGRKLVVSGAGTLRFGSAEDTEVALANVSLAGGATLAYAGPGAVTPNLLAAAGTTFALEGGSLAVPTATALGSCSLALGAGTSAAFAEGVTSLKGDLLLLGDATLSAASPLAVGGSLVRGAGVDAATLTLADGTAVTLGVADNRLRTFDCGVVPGAGSSLTLDGWIFAETDPAAFTVAGACTLFGPYATTGAVEGTVCTVDAQNAAFASVAALGAGVDTLNVRNGGTVVFCADGEETLAVTLNVEAASSVALGGAGTLDLTGTTLTGAGTVRLAGAHVVAAGDLSSLVLASDAGELDVPAGQTATVGAVTGTLRKTGAGTLVFVGAETNDCSLVVAAGTVRLASGAVAVLRNVTVDAGATVVLDADEQIGDDANLYLDGTFDLNGHSETLLRFYNTPASDSLRGGSDAALVNTGASPATISTREENAFFGRISQEPGAITLDAIGGLQSLMGAAGAIAPQTIRATRGAVVMPYTGWNAVKFVFHATRVKDKQMAISEIQLTRDGVPVPADRVTGVTASPAAIDGVHMRLVDNRADLGWLAKTDTNVVVTLGLKGYPRFNGYRLGAAGDVQASPTDWDVYVYRAGTTGWMLVDSRRGEKIVRRSDTWNTFSYTFSTNYLFGAPGRPTRPLSPDTRIDLAGSATNQMRVANAEALVVGPVVGTGGITVENGSAIEPADLTGWTGDWFFKDCESLYDRATIRLTTAHGGAAEQRVRLTAENANATVENAGAEPMRVLIDDAFPEKPLRGRLADGTAPLGLVKRGTGTRTLATGDSAYTGATVIEGGCLKVCGAFGAGRPVSGRYLRIWPKRNNKTTENGWDSNGFNWGMNDFQILDADGNRIAFPEGTTATAENGFHSTQTGDRLIDGNIATRSLVWNTAAEKTGKTGYCSWVVIDMKQSVAFSGYRWYTAHNNSADQYRVPVEWTLEVSDDGANWSVVDVAADRYTSAYGSGNDGFLRGPYALDGESDGVVALKTIPSVFFAETTPRSTHAPALKARYFRFQPHETYDMNADENSYGWMISEFALFRNGARVDWPAGAKPTLTGGGLNTNNGSSLAHFCDNVTEGGQDTSELHRVFVTQIPTYVTVDAGEDVTFDAYGFYSAGGGCVYDRIPTAWTVSISSDGTDWTVVDERTGERNLVWKWYALQGLYSVANRFPLLAAATATDAIGDDSPVTIAAGATLALDTDYERIGTLSGAGALTLNAGTVAEVNACVDGTFSGSVTGIGTLAFCGAATQTLDNATIGVARLELNGGTVTGAASRAGDLAIAFNGGAWSGSLAVSGALTATGTPSFAVPEALANGGRATLFSYGSADAAAQAVLRGADVVGDVPAGMKAKVRVGETACVLSVSADGCVLVFR